MDSGEPCVRVGGGYQDPYTNSRDQFLAEIVDSAPSSKNIAAPNKENYHVVGTVAYPSVSIIVSSCRHPHHPNSDDQDEIFLFYIEITAETNEARSQHPVGRQIGTS